MATTLVACNEVGVCAIASCNVMNEFRLHTEFYLLDLIYGRNLLFCRCCFCQTEQAKKILLPHIKLVYGPTSSRTLAWIRPKPIDFSGNYRK